MYCVLCLVVLAWLPAEQQQRWVSPPLVGSEDRVLYLR